MQLEGLQQQLLAAGIMISRPAQSHCLQLSAVAAHSAAINDAIECLPSSASYIAARNALICKFWASFTCPSNWLNRHSGLFDLHNDRQYLKFSWTPDRTCNIQIDEWVCQELRQTANVLQHDLKRMGYHVQLAEIASGHGYSPCPPQGKFCGILVSFEI